MPDLRITTRTNSAPLGETITITSTQNDRKRVEEHRQLLHSLRPQGPLIFVPGPPIVTITRCDLDKIFVLNMDDREYMSMAVPKPLSREALQARAAQQSKPAVQPTALIERTTQDTGERKQMFGYMARHMITTVKQTSLTQSGQVPQKRDGWLVCRSEYFHFL